LIKSADKQQKWGFRKNLWSLVVVLLAATNIFPYSGTAAFASKSIILKVDHSGMFIDDAEYSTLIDPINYATPTVIDNRVYLPISNIIREFGGSVQWSAADKQITINLDKKKVVMYLKRRTGFVNGSKVTFDAAPRTVDGRTMVPLRVVSQHLGLQLVWDQKNQVIALYHGQFDAIPTDYSEYFIPVDGADEEPSPAPSATPSNQSGPKAQVGDRVSAGFFYGEVKQVNGNRLLVYWDSKNDLFISDEDAAFWASMSGVRYKSSSWIEADKVTVER